MIYWLSGPVCVMRPVGTSKEIAEKKKIQLKCLTAPQKTLNAGMCCLATEAARLLGWPLGKIKSSCSMTWMSCNLIADRIQATPMSAKFPAPLAGDRLS